MCEQILGSISIFFLFVFFFIFSKYFLSNLSRIKDRVLGFVKKKKKKPPELNVTRLNEYVRY